MDGFVCRLMGGRPFARDSGGVVAELKTKETAESVSVDVAVPKEIVTRSVNKMASKRIPK